MALWVADAQKGLTVLEGGAQTRLMDAPCALCSARQRVYCASAQEGVCYCAQSHAVLMDFPVPPGVSRMAAVQQGVFALSEDADSISRLEAETGELSISAPAGLYPRDVSISPCGNFLAVAGGAAGEVLLFDTQLSCINRVRVAGIASAVCFAPRGMLALCAVGDHEVCSRLLFISQRGVSEEVITLQGAPSALLAHQGCYLAGCNGALVCLRADGRILYRLRLSYPQRIIPLKQGVLVADVHQGAVMQLASVAPDATMAAPRLIRRYQGEEPLDIIST